MGPSREGEEGHLAAAVALLAAAVGVEVGEGVAAAAEVVAAATTAAVWEGGGPPAPQGSVQQVNMAGQLCTLKPTPKRPMIPRSSVGTMGNLQGFMPGVLDGDNVVSPTGFLVGGCKGPGASRVRGSGGVALTDTSLPLSLDSGFARLLAREMTFILCGETEPPSGAAGRSFFKAALIEATTGSKWGGKQLRTTHFSVDGRLTEEGAQLILSGSGVRVHDAYRFYSQREGAPSAPSFFVRNSPAVSYLSDSSSVDYAGEGLGVSMGILKGLVTFPARSTLLPAASPLPSLEVQQFALLQRIYPDEDTDIEALARDIMLPMLLRGEEWHHHMLVPLNWLVAREHIQWRYGHETDNPLSNALWWYPQGGPRGAQARDLAQGWRECQGK